MKNIAAIFLIALFLFNLVGYRVLFNYAQQQSDTRMVAALDKADYNEADLITIKVPLSTPYQNDQADFERVDGEVKYKGKILKYVKRKMSDGNLILLCIPDNNKMRLQSAKDDIFKSTNDIAQNNNSKKSDHSKTGTFKNLLGDYISNTSEYATAIKVVQHNYAVQKQSDRLPSSPHNSPEQPPDVI